MSYTIIHLDRVDSTNTFLKELSARRVVSDYTLVTAKEQLHGHGQYGNTWQAQSGENITCSIYRKASNHDEIPFLMMSVSLAIQRVLSKWVDYCHIKWPNDILIRNKKICGILIETTPHKDYIGAVVGIGLNVNQTKFGELSDATSLKKMTGKHYDLKVISEAIIQEMRVGELNFSDENRQCLKQSYEEQLYKRDEVHGFLDAQGIPFNGIIKGVNQRGLLQILLEDDHLVTYDMKQIRFRN